MNASAPRGRPADHAPDEYRHERPRAERPPAMDDPGGLRPRPLPRGAGHDHRHGRAPRDRRRPRRRRRAAGLGGGRVHGVVREPAHHRRRARGPVRPAPGVRDRPARLRRRLARLRGGGLGGDAGRGAGAPGRGRLDAHPGGALDRGERDARSARAGAGDRRVGRDVRTQHGGRPGHGRGAARGLRLAGAVLDQPARGRDRAGAHDAARPRIAVRLAPSGGRAGAGAADPDPRDRRGPAHRGTARRLGSAADAARRRCAARGRDRLRPPRVAHRRTPHRPPAAPDPEPRRRDRGRDRRVHRLQRRAPADHAAAPAGRGMERAGGRRGHAPDGGRGDALRPGVGLSRRQDRPPRADAHRGLLHRARRCAARRPRPDLLAGVAVRGIPGARRRSGLRERAHHEHRRRRPAARPGGRCGRHGVHRAAARHGHRHRPGGEHRRGRRRSARGGRAAAGWAAVAICGLVLLGCGAFAPSRRVAA